MGKYDPLGAFLRSRDADETPMTFEEVEAVIGAPLPPKAAAHRAWWSNNPRNNVMTRVWLDAGFRTERVDLSGGKLVFRRVAAPAAPPKGPRRGILEALRRELGGTVRVRPGVDLTSPTGEVWDAEA
jgi:hypothetical protein